MEWNNIENSVPQFGQRVMIIYKIDGIKLMGTATYHPIQDYQTGQDLHIFLLNDTITVSSKFWFAIPEFPADA